MSRRHSVWLVAILVLVAICARRTLSSNDEVREQLEQVMRIYFMVQSHYIKPEKTKTSDLFHGACRGIVQALDDPHSMFMDVSQNQRFTEDTQGEFGGIGIEIGIKDGILTVVSPIAGTPAYEAGMMAGDRIIKIDGKTTERISLHEAVEKLRGKVGTKVALTIRHLNTRANEEIVITRAVIKPASLESSMLDAESKIGYIRVFQFTTRLGEEFGEVLQKLQAEGMKALVLDLRGNPGGDLNMAVRLSDFFVAEGPIVTVKGRDPSKDRVYSATAEGTFKDLPVVCLINQGSASASEIVAGCLRDHQRAMLVGETSYGKGSVQNVFRVGEGTALKLTTAQYFTPKDLPIEDHKGIEPDILIPMSPELLMSLRLQEREDKMRGQFVPGLSALNGTVGEKPQEAQPEEKPQAPEGEGGEPPDRRERVADIQLKAAVRLLQMQMRSDSGRQARR